MSAPVLSVDVVAGRLGALLAAVRAQVSAAESLRAELRLSADLAGLDDVPGSACDWPPRVQWAAEWNVIARSVAVLLAGDDTKLGRARFRRWDHHTSVVALLLEGRS